MELATLEAINHQLQINVKHAILCVKHVLAQRSRNATPVKRDFSYNLKPIHAINLVKTAIGLILPPMNARNAVN